LATQKGSGMQRKHSDQADELLIDDVSPDENFE
jgi:hypothetical protein